MAFHRTIAGSLVLAACFSAPLAAGSERAELARSLRRDLAEAERLVDEEHAREAEVLYRSALAASAAMGPTNLLTARAADGLADLLRSEGRLPDAEPLYVRSARLWERLLGPDQPRLATTLHNLAALYAAQGRWEECEARSERALAIWTASFGEASPHAENSRRLLAIARRETSRTELAD